MIELALHKVCLTHKAVLRLIVIKKKKNISHRQLAWELIPFSAL